MRPNRADNSATLLKWNSPVVFNGSVLGVKSIVCLTVGSCQGFLKCESLSA